MLVSSYIYRCDWNTQGDRCDAQSPAYSNAYTMPIGWSMFNAKTESDVGGVVDQKIVGPFHFCPQHTDVMFEEIVSDLTPGHPNAHPEIQP